MINKIETVVCNHPIPACMIMFMLGAIAALIGVVIAYRIVSCRACKDDG